MTTTSTGKKNISIMKYYIISFITCLIPRITALSIVKINPLYSEMLYNKISVFSNLFWTSSYPGYAWLSISVLRPLSGESMLLYIGYHLFLHSLIGPITLSLTRQWKLSKPIQWFSVIGVSILPYYVSTIALQPAIGIVIILIAFSFLIFSKWLNNIRSNILGISHVFTLIVMLFFRPEGVLVFGFLYFIMSIFFIKQKQFKSSLFIIKYGLVFLLFVGLIASINNMVTGKFRIPLPVTMGSNLWQGNNPYVREYVTQYNQSLYIESYYSDHPLPKDLQPIQGKTYKTGDLEKELIKDNIRKDLAINYIKSNPKEFLENIGLKFLRYWDFRLDDAAVTPLLWNLAYTIPYLLYVTLAIGGILIWKKEKKYKELSLISTVFVVHSIFLSFTITSIRYRMIFEFLLIVLAAVTANYLFSFFKSKT